MVSADASETFQPQRVDKVRASRDGHAFHEAWAAHSALELLPPSTSLTAIALEGLSVVDSADVSAGTVEIADLVRYHGARDIARANRVEVVQFKYSIASASSFIRAADLAATLTKFAAADAEFRSTYGDAHVESVVRYDFATNRPIHPNLLSAVEALIAGDNAEGDTERQRKQLLAAIGTQVDAGSLVNRLSLTGSRGSLKKADASVRQLLVSWSEANDPEGEKRLLKLRNLIRTKVGSEGEGQNVIDRVAVMAELGVDHEDQLYPTPDAFPPVEHVVARQIVDDVAAAAITDPRPLIVHAAGGMGKTVLMQAVAEKLAVSHRIVLFDGFGAGKWRDPSDGRHLPERTLVHIANLLAGQGLCDILLPVADVTALLRGFRRRLERAVISARQFVADARIGLLLDAIDHAGIEAHATGKESFAHLLLRSLAVDPIDGVSVIASCRTERLALAVGDAAHREMAVPPFTPTEAEELIRARDPSASAAEIAALQSRSGYNPRCLDALIAAGRPYDGPKPGGEDTTPQEILDVLLRERIEDAREVARSKGATDADLDLLLSGLSILPPPVPTSELAAAHRLTSADVESFAADLSPLLERTPHGLMFRDEPTETLIRKMSQSDLTSQQMVVDELLSRQVTSEYAARALPSVLTGLQDTDALVALAFDERVPSGASKVSQRDIRLARIVAALQACARTERYDDLIRVLLEAAVVAAGHERSDRFLYEYPDLAAVAGDAEALRRLFSTKIGWAGGRHSSLAIAHAFAGDMGEARRNSQRAIDWHNWAVVNHRAIPTDRVSRKWDDIGFGYVEMLSGSDIRLASWFARRTDAEMYDKFADILDLLERHAIGAGSLFLPRDRLFQRVRHCRLRDRGFWSAAFRYSTREPCYDGAIITKLARSLASERDAAPSMVMLGAAARAFQLGAKRNAREILKFASDRPSVHDYSSYWPMDRDAECAVIAAGIASALRGRSPNIMDLAPKEFLAAVPKSYVGRGAKVFMRALQSQLSDPPTAYPPRRRRRRAKNDLNYEDRSRHKQTLEHRILPLLPYAAFIAQLLDSRSEQSRQAVGERALAKLAADFASATNYPYRDQKSYIARVGFTALFAVMDAMDALNASVASQIVGMLKSVSGLFIPQLTEIVCRLSRREVCHDAALELAAHVETLIRQDTDTSSRISAYGELARAIWRVSTTDATSYFRRGLDLADAIGSDDFDRTNELLAAAAHYRGDELESPSGYNLARIIELNLSEASKFPWIEYGQAMASTAGLASIAAVARLDDRGQANLGLSLAPLLTELVTRDKMPADLACCLFALEEPVESWTFRLGRFAAAALPDLPSAYHEWLFDRLVIEIDRADQLVPWRETVADLVALARETLPSNSPSLARLQALLRLREAEPVVPRAEPLREDDLGAVDLSNSDSIDRAIDADADENEHRWPQGTIEKLIRRANSPAKRLALVNAVALANAPSLADKIGALEKHLDGWMTNSPGLRDALPDIALALASKHARELISLSWQHHGSWERLTRLFRADRRVLVARVIQSLAPISADVSGDCWLGLSAQLAPDVDQKPFKVGLERFLNTTGSTIPAEVGDGPWTEEFEQSNNPVDVSAGLIWARLGNYRAPSRWRAAHAVRRLAEIGRFDVIDRLAVQFDSPGPGPFTSNKLPFYPMHAQLWLLISLARIAKSDPAGILRYRELLERVAFNQKFPHIVMRHFAAEALRSLLSSLSSKDSVNLCRQLADVNAPTISETKKRAPSRGLYANRPEDRQEPANAFHLDYDFNKYHVSDLISAFGCEGWEIEDRITAWVRQWDASVRGMYDCPRMGHEDFNAGSWSSGYLPEGDRYGGYLGWHAAMLVAGDLLSELPVVGESWWDDPWDHVMRDVILSRRDGLWLSDLTDLLPFDLASKLPMPEVDSETVSRSDRKVLAPLVGIDNERLGDRLIVSGIWSLPEDVTLTVRSVLADEKDARALALAALTDRKFSQWIPDDEHEVERELGDCNSIRAWLRSGSDESRTLDRYDPYAASTALSRPTPSDWVVDALAITPMDEGVRRWRHGEDTALSASAWGVAGGRGEHSWDNSGRRIAVNVNLLRQLLADQHKVLVLFVKAQKYFRGRSTHKAGDTSGFSHRVLMVTVDSLGRVKFVKRLSGRAKALVNTLPQRDRHELGKRFEVIRAA